MGTTASTAQQTVSAGTSLEGLQGSSNSMDGQHSLSVQSFHATSLHNSKAKSIIPNKVAPVVITYNCKEEFQIHDELLKAHYRMGRLSDATPEHYLVQGRYFLVRDVTKKMDTLGTLESCGALNFRQVRGGLPVFGMGQPSLLGFRRVLQKLQKDGFKECIIFCLREEPVLFLRAEEDFVSYTPRDKESLHENLRDPGPGVKAEHLELAIRKEIHDFAQLRENVYHVYHNTEDLRGEPHTVAIRGEDDVHVTEEVFKRPLFLQPTYRFYRLPLPEQGAPPEAQFDAFVSVLRETPSLLPLRDNHGPPPALLFSCQSGVGRTNLGMVLGTLVMFHHSRTTPQLETASLLTKPLPVEQFQVVQGFICKVPQGKKMVEEVDRAINACAELHDLKEEVLKNQRKLEGFRPESREQGCGSQHAVQQRALWSLELYFYLILFNYYLHEQHPLAFALSFSRWLCTHPELYRLLVALNSVGPLVPGDLIAKGSLEADDLVSLDALSTIREMDVANFRRVPRMPIYGTAQPSAKALGNILAYLSDAKRKLRQVVWINLREEVVLECDGHMHSLWPPGPALAPEQLEALEAQLKAHLSVPVPITKSPATPRFQKCLTTQEVFSQHKGTSLGLTYCRIPVPDFCAPREEDFERLLEAMRAALSKDPGTGFVFSCLNGQGRTTTAMVVAVLACWHIGGCPEVGEEELVSVPDAKFTKGEFQVVMKVVQLLPDGHHVKKEVDAALDTVSETMTPMHYHLREIIISTYRQAKATKETQEAQRLHLRSLQYLERYIYLILFNAYLRLEKASSWQRPFSTWMQEVATRAGIYEILNQLGFPELESMDDQPLSRLRYRWQEQSRDPEPCDLGDFLYNCKEEFQIPDELLKAHYRMGGLSDATPEHYLVQVDRAINACAELHDLKEEVLMNLRKLEGFRPESREQGCGSQHAVQQRALWSLELYFYLILFNYYLHEQYPLAFALSFSQWLCIHPELCRLLVALNSVGPLVPGDLIAKGSLEADDLVSLDALSTIREMDVANFRRVPRMPIYGTAQPSAKALGNIVAYLSDAKRKLRQVVWINLREEVVLECDGHMHSLWPPGPALAPEQLEALEAQLKAHLSVPVPITKSPATPRFQKCLTTQEVFSQHQGASLDLTYCRIPVPDFCAPREENFERLLEAMRAALSKDPGTGFVFSCLNGQGRTTTAMVVAVLACWHIGGCPEVGEEELVSVPDAKFTKGEFQVVMKVVQLLPDGHHVKKEVDAALDTVSETMTPMHYHLREIIISTYRQAKATKETQEAQRLHLQSLQYLERYIYLILFNAYLRLEKASSWQRPFSTWMQEVATRAGIYEILNQLGFPELESMDDQPLSRLRYRWQEQSRDPEPCDLGDFL